MRTLIAVIVLSLSVPGVAQPRLGPSPIPPDTRVQRNIEYAKAPGDVSLKLDLFIPKSDHALPLLIFVHGGGWQTGSKNGVPVLELLGHGYAVASIDYRLAGVAPFPAQIFDCKAAVRFLRAHADDFNLDASHFGVWGTSAGGHLVALLGTSGDVKDLEGDLGNEGVSSRV